MINLNFDLFDASTILYASIVIVMAYVTVFIPSMMVSGSRPEGIAKAISCYLWKTFGLMLLGTSVVQLTINIMYQTLPDLPILSALILLLVVGIGIMVHSSRILATVDHASAMVPRLIFSHTMEIVGGLIAFVSALSLMLHLLITERIDGWQMPVTMGLLGFTLMLVASIHISANNHHVAKTFKRRK